MRLNLENLYIDYSLYIQMTRKKNLKSVSKEEKGIGLAAKNVRTVRTVRTDSTQGNTSKSNPKSRWCFTLHNYNDEDIKILKSMSCADVPKFKYCIFSEEKGESGETRHLQGYFELYKRKRATEIGLRKEYHFETAFAEKQKNIEYIEKEKGTVYINGIKVRKVKLISEFRKWQQKIIDLIDTEPDDRTINWIFDKDGCSGKTVLSKYICSKYNAIVLNGGTKDMFYGIISYKEKKGLYPDIIIIDIPRSVDLDYLNYTAIEKIKDGIFFSNKYESSMCIFPNPHVFVFSNELPDLSKMTGDRWNIC